MIHKLALLRVFIEQTDHLSDRELYTHPGTESLREKTQIVAGKKTAWHIQLLGGAAKGDAFLYLKYYADEAGNSTAIGPTVPFRARRPALRSRPAAAQA